MFLPFVPPPKRKRPLHPFGCVPSHSKKPSEIINFLFWVCFVPIAFGLTFKSDLYWAFRQINIIVNIWVFIDVIRTYIGRLNAVWELRFGMRELGAGNLENISSTNFRHSWDMLKLIIIVISRIADTYANSYFYGYN